MLLLKSKGRIFFFSFNDKASDCLNQEKLSFALTFVGKFGEIRK